MSDLPHDFRSQDFKPLDPGRIETADPHELQYWCRQLDCTEEQLQAALAQAGNHVAQVRAQLEAAQ